MRPRHLAISVGVVFAAVATSGGTVIVPAVRHAITHATATVDTRQGPVTGSGETAFFRAVLRDLGAPVTAADLTSLTAWAAHEGPWGTVAQWNPLDSTLDEPGSTWFNTFGNGYHVRNYPSATVGAYATALTIEAYPLTAAALRSGAGMCGNGSLSGELLKWSNNAYRGVC